MSDLPEWTPGPGTYPLPTDFVKKQTEKLVTSQQMDESQLQSVELVPSWNQRGYGFGTGTRPRPRPSGVPGPGHYPPKDGFATTRPGKPEKVKPRTAATQSTNPHSYDVKNVIIGPKFSFGTNLSSTMLHTRRSMPAHLRRNTHTAPGPGTYELPTGLHLKELDGHCKAQCTWSVTRGGFNDLPRDNPGPGTYDLLELGRTQDLDRSRALEPGFSFPGGPRDVGAFKNTNPGPDTYWPRLPKSGTSKRMLGGPLGLKPLIDNGVPGPGTYQPDPAYPIHTYKIMRESEPNEKQQAKAKEGGDPVGPQTYNPEFPQDSKKGTRFGTSERREENTTNRFAPAPNRYQLLGDFDFRDPTKPDEKLGKLPKFAFGIKPIVKAKNLDVPGPAEYNTDRHPMNQKNIAYWIGTEVRRDMSIPYSHLYPGPGHYEHQEPMSGPHISFTHEEKKTKIEKTFEPGPGSYTLPVTVGVIPEYNRYDTHPRETLVHTQKAGEF